MPLLTIEQCRAQCRVDSTYADTELLGFLASAEADASAYLNRSLFKTATDLDTALTGLADRVVATADAYESAIVQANVEVNQVRAEAMRRIAEKRRASAVIEIDRTLHGMVANAAILGAVRLTLGNLYANRESVVIGATAAELPLGAVSLLRPHRRVMGL